MQKLLTTREAAEFLRMQPQTLAKKRMNNEGPKYIRVPSSSGKNPRVLYDLEDLKAYLGLPTSDNAEGHSKQQ